jgi:hypothetical protein
MADIEKIKTDEICDDPHIAELKAKQMKKFRWHSMLGSIAETFKFLAVIFTAVGTSAAIRPFAEMLGSSGLIAAFGAIPVSGVLFLGMAAVATAVAIAATYKATNIWTDGQFNNYEISAKSTAHHMVQEIEAHNLCLTENKGRADGKSWCDVAKASKAAQISQSL